jgi:integrase
VKRRRDTGKWEVRWRENGRNRSKSFTLKGDAARFEAQVQRAREVGRPLDLDRGRETLSDFVGVFWRRYALTELSPKTRADYRGVWERHVRSRLGGYRLRDVTPAVVDEFRSELRAAGTGEATVSKALTLLSSMYRCAVTWDRVDVNPLREIRIPQAKRKRLVRPVPPARVEAMRMALLAAGRRRDAVLLTTLAYAGLRPQEARALRWGDVAERTIRIERAAAGATIKATKTEELRTVRLLMPLAKDLASLRATPGDDDLVFPSPNGLLMSDGDWRNWRKRVFRPVAAALGVGGSRPYDLRHSFASLLIDQGASVVEVARQMGNAPSVTLDTYAHLFDERDTAVRVDPAGAIERAREAVDVRAVYAEAESLGRVGLADLAKKLEALLRTRTADPLLTMEVLYQLS